MFLSVTHLYIPPANYDNHQLIDLECSSGINLIHHAINVLHILTAYFYKKGALHLKGPAKDRYIATSINAHPIILATFV